MIFARLSIFKLRALMVKAVGALLFFGVGWEVL